MPIRQFTDTRPPDQQVVVSIADQVRRGRIPTTARYPLADLLVLVDQHASRLPLPVAAAVDAVIATFRTSTDEVPPLMVVRLLDRSAPVTRVRTVRIPALCIRCGSPRGEAQEVLSTVHGMTYVSDFIDNPCGHLESAQALLAEARRFADLVGDVEALTGGVR